MPSVYQSDLFRLDHYHPGTAAKRYEALKDKRDRYLNRGRACAAITIPSLMPEEGRSPSDCNLAASQSLGAMGVKQLAAKLLLALFPPSEPFFRFRPPPEFMVELEKEEQDEDRRDEILAEIDVAAARYERMILRQIASLGDRVTLSEAFKHLLVVGNGLLHIEDKSSTFYQIGRAHV